MKHAVSISLGSSKRDMSVKVNLSGQGILLGSIGMDRDIAKVRQMYWSCIPQYCSCKKLG
jgi:hypothetical protein